MENVIAILKNQVEEKKYIDVGAGAGKRLGITQTKLMTAIKTLQSEGYKVSYIKVQQADTEKPTAIKVLSGPGIPYSEVFHNRDQIKEIDIASVARMLRAEETFHEHLKKIEMAQEMKAKGYGNAKIARQMGISESSVRALLKGD